MAHYTRSTTPAARRAWIQSNINSNNSGMGTLSGLTPQQIGDGQTLTDPTLWSLVLLSAGLLWRRRARAVAVPAAKR